MFHQVKTRRPWYRLFYWAERGAKETLLDCHMCGQCVVRSTALTCPMRCPKQLRNGPCGGSVDGHCEVYPERPCIWTLIHQRGRKYRWMRAKRAKILPAVDWRLFGSSAWLNIWPERKIRLDGRPYSPAPVPCGNRWEAAPTDSQEPQERTHSSGSPNP